MTDYTTKKLPQLDNLPLDDATGDEDILINQNGVDKRIKAQYLLNESGNEFDYIALNTDPPTITDQGTIIWNKQEYTIDVITGLGATIQVGEETLLLYYNDSGSTITNGQVLHPKAATTVGGTIIPTPELADASDWEKCEGTLTIATHDIADSSLGFATRFGKVRGLDTSGFTPGQTVYLSATTPGALTGTMPVFPNYVISMGGALNSDPTDGIVFASITRAVGDTFNDAWDGAIRETFDFRVTSDGSTVTGTLTNSDNPLLNLTLLFSDGFYTLDTVSGVSISLTPGTDAAPASNYVYIPISTKVLTLSTSGFPSTEHCKVAILEVQSATTVQSEGGARRNQNINDHIKTEDDNGHILHIAERVRQLNAEHDNGTEGSLTGVTTNGYVQVTSGEVWQLHKQSFPAFSMPTDNILIVNDNTTSYRSTNNLNTITAYSDGSSWNNQWGKFVVWGVANKSGETSYVMGNLPSAGYNSESSAIEDALNYADYTIPNDYKGVGFLIAAFTFRISAGAITYNGGSAYQDLRGFVPNNIAGGGGGSGITTYLGLTDTPSSYSGEAGNVATVNSGETGLEFTTIVEVIQLACSDETTALTTGTAKITFRMPFAMTLTDVRASLTGAGSTSGTTTVDINEGGTTILSTKLTIDFGEKTSTTAATPPVISDTALADDSEITIDIDAVTGGADETGLKVSLIGYRS
jgi:hypothetical protein